MPPWRFFFARLALGAWRSKADLPAQKGQRVLNPALTDVNFDSPTRIAQAEIDRHRPQVMVGSARGGDVAMHLDSGNALLILLRPA